MATITASLERSLKNCSLNQNTRSRRRGGGGGVGRSSSSDSPENHHHHHHDDHDSRSYDPVTHSNASSSDDNSAFVELNSHLSLPYHWEQCLDLKTGEIYYINWRNGKKAKEDPRTSAASYKGDNYNNSKDDEDEDEDEDDEEDHNNSYESEGSSTESSTSTRESFRSAVSGRNNHHHHRQQQQQQQQQDEIDELSRDSVLVVAGCKSCLMYYMLPKHVDDCPKCSGQLLHFAASNNPPITN